MPLTCEFIWVAFISFLEDVIIELSSSKAEKGANFDCDVSFSQGFTNIASKQNLSGLYDITDFN